jgi:multimeric flavodoxin WrbA
MKVAVIHGSPRKGNTYKAARIFMGELALRGGVEFVEFLVPQALPMFCTGCQLCLGNPNEMCPHSEYVTPILNALLKADAIIVASPHYGGSSIPGGLKNLFDHLSFLSLPIAPREEMFSQKAFVITTGTGSTGAIKLIRETLKGWGVNRVYAIGLRMFTDKWDMMPTSKQARFDRVLRRNAQAFRRAKHRRAYISTVFMYYMAKLVIRKYIGENGYPYRYWDKRGWLGRRPF